MKEFKAIIQAMELYKRSKKHFPILDNDIPTLQAVADKPLKAINHRIKMLQELMHTNGLSEYIMNTTEARLDELETLKDYLEKSK